MSLVLTEEQELLKETAAEFLREHAPVTHLREFRDREDAVGFSRKLWKEMAALGWAGIPFEETFGGAELGMAELGVVLEECGRNLAPYPFLSTVVMGGGVVAAGGTDAQKQAILPGVCEGETILALAFQETGRFSPYAISTKAEAGSDGFKLSGEKVFVLDGHVADHLIVAARTSGTAGERDGLTLFLVDPSGEGCEVIRTNTIDSRNTARVRLSGVAVETSAVLGEIGAGADLLDLAFDRATVAVSAELVGISTEVFERTVTYLKTREQFGVLIGTFQALKHRAAEMFCEVELSQAVVLDALRALDEDRPGASRLASAAKARCSDAASLVTCEGLQMHGGIGMTDEEEIGLFLKRAKVAELTLGDAAYHRDRFAQLTGF
ncbi:MAG: acyl-CoA dehydrogenase family protein [Deltaproteobacteria bacterium]|nr:acyl-CoA dehydrogenase family protein [Deltaproteobacteria bacterium]MBW2394868.1 acyl-CoA dehydrogenase family protein [Deltaproteobacteria bacterium]